MNLVNWQVSLNLETCRRRSAHDSHTIDLRRKILVVLVLLLLPTFGKAAQPDHVETDAGQSGNPSAIISKFVEATQSHQELRGASMQVDIDASIVKLKEHGKLRALRRISRVGEVTYRVLGFQGDNTVKNDVIARYLQAEQQGRGDQKLTISPANYKFKFKGKKNSDGGQIYVFQLSPRENKVGLFKGEVWLDANTCLPLVEKGKLVKTPSIWFKKVEFERDFAIINGVSLPKKMSSTIDVRVIGTVNLQIDYSNFVQNAEAEDDGHAEAGQAEAAAGLAKLAAK